MLKSDIGDVLSTCLENKVNPFNQEIIISYYFYEENEILTFLKDNFSDINGYKISEYDDLINLTIPSDYCKFPELLAIKSSIKDISRLKLLSIKELKQYFINLKQYDSYNINRTSCFYQKCYYCNEEIDSNNKKFTNSYYYYCYNCFISICQCCNNHYKNCKKNKHKIFKRSFLLDECHAFYCDLCSPESIETINDKFRYSNLKKLKIGQFTDDNIHTTDICINCAKTSEGKEIITKHKLQLIDNFASSDQSMFGSLLDWIPFLTESFMDGIYYVLFCANPINPLFHKIGFIKIDDLNRVQIISTYEAFDELLLTEEIETIIDNINKEELINTDITKNFFIHFYLGDMIDARKIKFVTS
jgi:hypothetical protein